MRFLLFIFSISFTISSFGQSPELIETQTEKYYKILLQDSSLNKNFKYPNGRYKIFKSNNSKLPLYVFHIKNGMIDGPYLELKSTEYTYGTYYQDSTWSFLYFPDDTTYKIGTWLTTYIHYSGLTKSYNNYTSFEIEYKIPFDSNDTFREFWFYHNGRIAREAIFKKEQGIVSKTYWDFKTNEITKQTVNSKTQNYSHSIEYKNDSIIAFSVTQNGVEVYISYYSLWEDSASINISVYDSNGYDHIPFINTTIDSTKNVSYFGDMKRQFFLKESENGDLYLEYINKKGKRKTITLE